MWHGGNTDPRLIEVYDAECLWGWEDDFFMAVLAEHSAPRVLDLGCGTGRLSIAMAKAGHDVTGVDLSAAALDAARRKPGADRVRWLEGSAGVLPVRAFDAAVMTDHVAQTFVTDDEWAQALRALRRSLVTDGRLIFDSRDPAAREWERWNPEESWRRVVLADGSDVEVWAEVTSAGRDGVVDLARHFRFAGGPEVISPARFRFRSEERLRESLQSAGFRVERIYGGWGREPVGLSGDGELIVTAVAESRPI